MNRFQRPETSVLKISNGDTLVVKRHLNTGETRAFMARMYDRGDDGVLRVNRLMVEMATVTAYLVDWSIVDAAGQRVPIADKSVEQLTQILDGLTPETFKEIHDAIVLHENAMALERDAAKKALATEPAASAISTSHDGSDGASTGSESLTPSITS